MPFTLDTIQNMMNMPENVAGECNEGDRGQMRYGEDEAADKEFNCVMKIDDFDNMYLL